MTDIEQRARDALNEVCPATWAVIHKRKHYHAIEAMCRALEAHDATKAEFSEAMRELDARLADMGMREIGKARTIARRFILPEPVDPVDLLVDQFKELLRSRGVATHRIDDIIQRMDQCGLAITKEQP